MLDFGFELNWCCLMLDLKWMINWFLCECVIGMLFWDVCIRRCDWVWEVFLGQGSIRYKVCYSLFESDYKCILRGICFVFFNWAVCVINWEVHRREVSNTSVLKQIGCNVVLMRVWEKFGKDRELIDEQLMWREIFLDVRRFGFLDVWVEWNYCWYLNH